MPAKKTEGDVLLRLVDIYLAADKYDIKGLRELVCSKLQRLLSLDPQRTEGESEGPFKRKCEDPWEFESIVELLEAVYSSAILAPLRKVIFEYIIGQDMVGFIECKAVSEAIHKTPEIGIDVFKALATTLTAGDQECGCRLIRGLAIIRDTCSDCNQLDPQRSHTVRTPIELVAELRPFHYAQDLDDLDQQLNPSASVVREELSRYERGPPERHHRWGP